MPEQRGYRSTSTSRRERARTYTRRPYFRPARGLPFGPAKRSVCDHPAPSTGDRSTGDSRGPLHPFRRSKGDKAGRRRRPRPSGGGIGRLKDRFLVALFYGLLARSHERYPDACIQLPPVPVGIRATLGVRGAVKEREGLLIALWHLPPLEALALGVVPTHALELCHCEDSTPQLNDSLSAIQPLEANSAGQMTSPPITSMRRPVPLNIRRSSSRYRFTGKFRYVTRIWPWCCRLNPWTTLCQKLGSSHPIEKSTSVIPCSFLSAPTLLGS